MLKNGKVPGADYIILECLKNGEQLIKQLHNLICKILKQKEIPIKRRTSILCPVFKKDDTINYKDTNYITETSRC